MLSGRCTSAPYSTSVNMSISELGKLLSDTAKDWWEDKAARLGAALAFYTIFSLAPLLIIILGIAGFLFGGDPAQSQLVEQIQGLVGAEGGKAVESMLQSAGKPESGIIAVIIGVIMLLFGAAGVFGQLQDALNTIWKVEPKPGRGLWGIIQDRFLSLTMVLGVSFLLLVSLSISAFLAGMVQLLGNWQVGWIGHLLNETLSLVVITVLFAMMFKFLPDAKVEWNSVWPGATLTALFFVVGKFLIGLYLGHSGIASAYGAAGSLVVLLLWLYYSSQIFLFGAEFTRIYAKFRGASLQPAENARLVTKTERAQQGMPLSER